MKDDALRRNFVRRLNYYMDANKLTQADLARHMGVSTATTAKWATGVTMPRMDKSYKTNDFDKQTRLLAYLKMLAILLAQKK